MSPHFVMPQGRRLLHRVVLAAMATPSLLAAQSVRLTVRDSLSQEPVTDAIATLVRRSGEVAATGITRSGGQVLLKARGSGSYALFIRKLGFEPKASDWFEAAAGDTLAREVVMHRIPQFLADVAIRGERESIRSSKFFGMRIGTLGAVIITPSQVDEALHGANDYSDLVSRNPSAGIGVDYQRKCVVSNRGDPPGCLPVIVDGLLLTNVGDVVPPEIVDYMLIVRGNEIGVMYGSIGEQGAVIIFTKRGLKRGPQLP